MVPFLIAVFTFMGEEISIPADTVTAKAYKVLKYQRKVWLSTTIAGNITWCVRKGEWCWLKQITILSKCGSALDPNPVIFDPTLSAVKIAPSESECAPLRKMVKICAFSSIGYKTSSTIIFHLFLSPMDFL
jgi:hypothetical protein